MFLFSRKYDIINLNFLAAELRRPSALQELRWLRQKLRSDAARHAQDIVPDTLFCCAKLPIGLRGWEAVLGSQHHCVSSVH